MDKKNQGNEPPGSRQAGRNKGKRNSDFLTSFRVAGNDVGGGDRKNKFTCTPIQNNLIQGCPERLEVFG